MPIPLPHKHKLWIVEALVQPELADTLSDHLGETALALTIMAPPRQPLVRVEAILDYAPDIAALVAQAAILAAITGTETPAITCRPSPPLDWLKKVAEDFPPFRIGRWTIHGALHRHKVADRRMALQIDATNAFGTGEHPTTRGCLALLDELLKRKPPLRRMLDVGCGSGILAMAYTKAAKGHAVAVDLDPLSVIIATHNRNTNGLRRNISAVVGAGYRHRAVKLNAPYDLIMSNIFARPLSLMAKDLHRNLRPGGVAILAGLLTAQANMVINAHRHQGLKLIRRKRDGEWTILAFRRPHKA